MEHVIGVESLTKAEGPTAAERDAIDVAFASSGDTQAFERLYWRHVGRVQSVARWLLATDDVDDVVQDVFVRVWDRIHTFRGDAAFGTWLHRLATNVILRRRQQGARRNERQIADELVLETTPSVPETPGLRIDLEAAVSRLPGRAREVFVLHDVAGYKHDEIAESLGISAGTSRSQLHHARMALRGYFAAEGQA